MKIVRYLVLLIATGFVSGCIDEIIDTHSQNKLVIWGDEPPEGQVGEPYVFRIGARVENTPNDDAYDFVFKWEDGTLPPGTAFRQYREGGVDYAEVVGVPTEAGSYTFAVTVRSNKLKWEYDAELDDDTLFPNTVYQDEGLYTIYIVE
ncbi:hypothetical protein P0Y35_00790 [Kiritimatiellaeota bacterium B1221]|nr:hypothetical protein [Kiritimatiellaeota bacterium B1221]